MKFKDAQELPGWNQRVILSPHVGTYTFGMSCDGVKVFSQVEEEKACRWFSELLAKENRDRERAPQPSRMRGEVPNDVEEMVDRLIAKVTECAGKPGISAGIMAKISYANGSESTVGAAVEADGGAVVPTSGGGGIEYVREAGKLRAGELVVWFVHEAEAEEVLEAEDAESQEDRYYKIIKDAAQDLGYTGLNPAQDLKDLTVKIGREHELRNPSGPIGGGRKGVKIVQK